MDSETQPEPQSQLSGHTITTTTSGHTTKTATTGTKKDPKKVAAGLALTEKKRGSRITGKSFKNR